MEYFVGLSFHPGSIHHKKIESFRKRFDSKYQHLELLQLTLLPPFHIDFKNNVAKIKKIHKPLKTLEIVTDWYPGFMTDWQPIMTLLLAHMAKGKSTIHERIFEPNLDFSIVSDFKQK